MKKILSIILSLTVIMSTVVMPVFANENRTETDNEKISLITELGIVDYPSDEVVLDEQITRAEFVLYAGRLIGVGEDSQTSDRYYQDLPADHWAAGVINTMTERGILKGNNGLFRPDDPITMLEAVTIILSTLGFDDFVSMKGGWPSGCMALASEFDLTNGIKNTDGLTLIDVYRLMYNTMFAPVPEMDLSSPSNPVIKINKDETIMGTYFDVYRVTGKLQSALGMSVDANAPCGPEELRIDGEVYNSEYTSAVDYLGCKVNAYYRKSDNERTVFLMFAKSNDDILEIDIKDFEEYDESAHAIKYESGSRTKIQQIAVSATVLKNGANYSSDIRGAFEELEQGTIRLARSDSSKDYDTVIIKNYEDVVVFSNDTTKKQIYDKIDNGSVTELDDVKHLRIFDANGKEASYEDIVQGNVLSVCRSEDFCEIIISSQINTGVVETLDTSGDEPTITIDGTSYTLNKKFIRNNPFALRVGYTVTYYINAFGNCVYAQSAGTDNSLSGYIINSGVDFETVVLKLLTQTGSLERIECAEKVTVNGKACSGADKIYQKLAEENNGKVNKQLILYRLDEGGKIKRIETAAPYGTGNNGSRELWQDTELKRAATFYTTNLMMGESIKLTNSTICFVIPPEADDDSDYTIIEPTSFLNEEEYDVTAYKTDDSTNTADILVVSSDATAGNWFHQILLVDKIYEEVDPETGDIEEYADMWLNGNKTKYAMAKDYKLSAIGIKSGDILRVDKNGKDEITAAYRAYDYEKKIPNGLNSTFWWEIYITYGYITSIKNNVAKFQYQEESGLRTGITTLEGVPIMIYDGSKKNKVEIGSISDVIYAMNHNELVFVGQKFGATTCLIITR
ncbi:MAG: S-layer homology domain-containing protein [Clostridiales bacterium]|nr:S-layer homology domain-containing protein [Clostridiales bacterium]